MCAEDFVSGGWNRSFKVHVKTENTFLESEMAGLLFTSLPDSPTENTHIQVYHTTAAKELVPRVMFWVCMELQVTYNIYIYNMDVIYFHVLHLVYSAAQKHNKIQGKTKLPRLVGFK
jgi:hypothetical protein